MSEEDYVLIFTNQFVKDFEKLSRQNQKRVRRALDGVRSAPYRGRRVKGAKMGRYRWRVGDLRIRYDIEEMEIYLLRVTGREDIYRKF
jgi:mRNA-degrading endonuclease RelE of RelBE toxin-antitoxin system